MSKPRVCVVVTARPSYARVKHIIHALLAYDDIETQVVVGCSALLERYGAVVKVMRSDGVPVSEEVWATVEGENLLTSALGTSVAMAAFANTFNRLQPDVVLIHADRHELLAPASAARLLEIPIAHTQAGKFPAAWTIRSATRSRRWRPTTWSARLRARSVWARCALRISVAEFG